MPWLELESSVVAENKSYHGLHVPNDDDENNNNSMARTVTAKKAIFIKSHIAEIKDNQKYNLYKRLQQICKAEKILCIYFSDTGKRHLLLGFSGRTPV